MLKLFPKFKYFLLIFLLLLEGYACTRKKGEETLTVAIPAGPILLDPRFATDAQGQKIADLIYDGLVTWDENLNIVPLLAENWEQKSPLEIVFHLRKGVRFSNGRSFTARDVLCTYGYIQQEQNVSPFRGEFSKIKLEALNDYTLKLTLQEPYAPVFVMLRKGILPCAGGDKTEQEPVGTGPYSLKKYKKDAAILLKANPDYFGGAPKIKQLRFETVKDDNTRVLKLLNKEVDLVLNGVPAILIEKVLQNKNIKMKTDVGTTFAYMGLNLKDEILKNKKVRQAMAYAIDRDVVITHMWKGFARKADSLLTPSHWAYDKELSSYAPDLEKAKKLLDEAGYPDAPGERPRFFLSLKTSTNKERIEIAKLLAHQLSKVGIGVKVEPFEWGTFLRDIRNGNFQLYTSTWVGVAEPDIYYNIFHSGQFPPKGVNRNFFVNKTVDALTTEGRSELSMLKRKNIYRKIQNIMLEELPYIPLWYENNIVLYHNDLKGVRLTPDPNYRNFVGIYR